ncbi:unnamed protein product [Schistosoma mattheei]|uniref:Uncharacterized protein n=1 Tax=Schistosoma mattheei TaxID=31246 RepID=A0A183NSD8_9TREM|nr:unnamed protein product [Schistosoma mattheei]
MVVEGSQQETLDLGFMLLGTHQKGVPVILSELILPDRSDPISPSFSMQSHSEDHHQLVNNRGEINPSIVNTHQRLDNEINEIGQDQNIEQDKIIHQLIQSNKGSKINQQPSVTQISAAASFFTR